MVIYGVRLAHFEFMSPETVNRFISQRTRLIATGDHKTYIQPYFLRQTFFDILWDIKFTHVAHAVVHLYFKSVIFLGMMIVQA